MRTTGPEYSAAIPHPETTLHHQAHSASGRQRHTLCSPNSDPNRLQTQVAVPRRASSTAEDSDSALPAQALAVIRAIVRTALPLRALTVPATIGKSSLPDVLPPPAEAVSGEAIVAVGLGSFVEVRTSELVRRAGCVSALIDLCSNRVN